MAFPGSLALLLLAVAVTHHTSLVAAVDFVIVADQGINRVLNGSIQRAPMADLYSFAAMPLYGLIKPTALDYDPVGQVIYWTDQGGYDTPSSISRANLDGTNQQILQQDVGESNGVAVDYLNNEIYWTDTTNDRIMKASSTRPSTPTPVIFTDLTSPHDIALDVAGRRIYWSDWGSRPRIERSNFDGSDRRVLINNMTHPGVMEPYGLTLDFEGQKLYFCDPLNNSIYLSDLDGYGLHNLVEIVRPEIQPFDLAFYSNNIYWTDRRLPALVEAERYQGLYAQLAGPFAFKRPSGIIIHTDTDRSCYDQNQCQSGGRCRQFIEGYECVCEPPFIGDNCQLGSTGSCASNPCNNDGQCNQTIVGHECLCKAGYSGATCDSSDYLIVADTIQNKIWTTSIPINRATTYTEVPIPNNTTAPKALDFDPVENRIYWSDNYTISSINLDGTDQRVITSDIDEVQGLALDTSSRKLYWTDIGRKVIRRSDLTGNNIETVVSGVGRPWNIIVDPAGGRMYFTDIEKEKHLATIERANLDGTDQVALLPANLFQPLALVADFSANQLYFGDALVNRIETCDLDGRNRRVLIQLRQTDAHPFDLRLHQDLIYWSDNNLPRIGNLNRYGSIDGALLVGPAQFDQAAGMTIYQENDGSCSSSPCKNGGRCRQLILGYQCVCDDTDYIGDTCEQLTDASCNSNPCQNGARCQQKVNGYDCICIYGYSGSMCDTEDLMYIADTLNGTIYKGKMKTLTFEPIIQNITSPAALKFDAENQKLYWADNVTGVIMRANADGTGQEIFINGLISPGDLSIDRGTRKIYWTDSGAHNIARANMDGNDRQPEIVVQTDIQKPQHIDVDWRNNFIYWTNWQEPVRIERLKTDLTGRETVINATNPNDPDSSTPWMVQPFGMAIDYSDETLFWGDTDLNKICSFDLNTKEQRTVIGDAILGETDIHPYDVAVYGEYLYWSDPVFSGLVEINRRFPVALNAGSVEFGKAGGLDIYSALPGCWSEPCKNGAECFNGALDSYICSCLPGYTGVHCQTEINECNAAPCVNEGLCQDEVNDYSCYCPAGYTGKNCDIDVDECTPNPCQNNGMCSTPVVNSFSCNCTRGNCGDRCEILCPPVCDSNPCQNLGTCIEPVIGVWRCMCVAGYTGDACETRIPPCSSNPCYNRGSCIENSFGYSCDCEEGFEGTRCETDINECGSYPCLNRASCFDGVNSYACVCAPGYTGIVCGNDIDECDSNPCQNNGICQDSVNTYSCECARGWYGDNCEMIVEGIACDDDPCQNGGTCVDRGGVSFVCVCPPTYTGRSCETLDACTSTPCMNLGTCISTRDGYMCNCYSGFTGINCESDIDECVSLPCINGGTCENQENRFACRCPWNFEGYYCQLPVDVENCDSSPCMNGGTCEGRSSTPFKCRCQDGYSGDRCEIDIDECLSYPCLNNGKCNDKIDGFMCSCPTPYTGDRCETYDGCDPPKFKNGYLIPDMSIYKRGEKLDFVCHNDYDIKGTTSAICSEDGWSNVAPSCVAKDARGGNPGGTGTAVGLGIGAAIGIFLLVLIILVIVYFCKISKKSLAPDEMQIVGYTNQGQGGSDYDAVHIGGSAGQLNDETVLEEPKTVD